MKERSRYLLEGFIDQTLNETELRELKQLIAEVPTVGKELAETIHLHGLADTLHHRDYEELCKCVDEAITDLSANQLEQAVLQTIKSRPSSNKRFLPLWGLAIAAQIMILLSLWSIRTPNSGGAVEVATVSSCNGSTFLVRGEKKEKIEPGTWIHSGDQIFVEVDSEAILRYKDKSELFLRDRSYVKLVDVEGAKHVHLFAGVLQGDIQKQSKGKPLRVHTEYSRATVLGTKFEINSSDVSDLLEVTEGSVHLEQVDSQQNSVVGQAEYAVSGPGNEIEVKQKGAPIYQSPVITKNTPGHGVEIEVDVTGAKKLYLVTSNGGDNNRFDHVVWLHAKLSGIKEYDLTKQKWTIATSGWRTTRLRMGYFGNPIQVEGIVYDRGIVTHATSVVAYDIPDGCHTFSARAALLDSGLAPPDSVTSVRFEVYTELPENKLHKLLIRKTHY